LAHQSKSNARASGIPDEEIYRYGVTVSSGTSKFPFMGWSLPEPITGFCVDANGRITGELITLRSNNEIDCKIKFI